MPHDGPGEHHHDVGERVAGHDDTVVWTTVGLDIGSSTSQAVFSRITLVRQDAYYAVVDRAVLHQSEIFLTPYVTAQLIDQARLGAFIEREFAAANLSRTEIDNGAVIMTGLALSTSNARAIAEIVADDSGRFVAVSAGDLLEARLAAHGAGLADLSLSNPGIILHIDIGGGTTKMSSWAAGKVLSLAAINVGARLVTVDADGCVVRIEPPIVRLAKALDLNLKVGNLLSTRDADAIAEALAWEVLRFGRIMSDRAHDPLLSRTAPLFPPGESPEVQAVVFSGGVSEYVYERERRKFGDLGAPLGRAVRAAVRSSGVRLLDSERGIRATVLGASQHSVQLSGNTIFVSDPSCLPLRNLPVLLPAVNLLPEHLHGPTISQALDEALHGFTQGVADHRGFAIAFVWAGSPTYQRLEVLAQAIAGAVEPYLTGGLPNVVIVEGDVAGLLGARLRHRFAGRRAVICLDGIHLHEFDHVDIGEFGQHSRALPVVVKSLLFAQSAGNTDAHH